MIIHSTNAGSGSQIFTFFRKSKDATKLQNQNQMLEHDADAHAHLRRPEVDRCPSSFCLDPYCRVTAGRLRSQDASEDRQRGEKSRALGAEALAKTE